MESQTSQQKVIVASDRNSSTACSNVLRLLAVVTTMVAAIVMSQAKETKSISMKLIPTLPPFTVPVTAKWSYSSAFVYFIVVNIIACCYSALSLAMSIAGMTRKRNMLLLVRMTDVVVLALLFSGNGAAAAIGVVGERGIGHVGWKKVCDVYTKFCSYLLASIAVSLVGCLAYLLQVVGSQHRKSAHV